MKNIKEVLFVLFFGFYLYISVLATNNYIENIVIEIVIGATFIGMLGYTMSLVYSSNSKKEKLYKRLAVVAVFLVLILIQNTILK